MSRRAMFLDRDGTLNRDFGYIHRQEDWQWLPGVPEALARFAAAGMLLVVVSNQSGVARGMFSRSDLLALERHAGRQLAAYGVRVAGWYYCPHLPEISGACACRKPAPGLLRKAACDLDIDLSGSWMLGDRLRDVRAGLNAGCHSALVRGQDDAECRLVRALEPGVPVFSSLGLACGHILGGGVAP